MFNNKKIWQAFLLLAFVIIACSIITRTLTSSKTLYEYAQENPNLAYGTQEDTVTIENTISEENCPETETILTENTTSECEASILETSMDTISENEISTAHPDRFTYAEGFFYEPITPAIEKRITGISYPSMGSEEISLDDLYYLNVLYNDFEAVTQTGELICNRYIAQDLVEIFEELYRSGYQFERISLIDEYNGDDTLSMEHNNTSCFNYRVVDGTTNLSKHAYGLAVDINPFYNPYVVYNKDGSGETYISPKGSEVYADRSIDFPYKIDENDLCYKLFTEHGFTWGGHWNSSKDYQHFQKIK